MNLAVAHFVRKSTQLNASFIYNQISFHNNFVPYIIFRKKVFKQNDGGFANFNITNYTYLDLSEKETWYEKILFLTVKKLSSRQINMLKHFLHENHINICHFHYGSDCGVFYPLLKKIVLPSVVSFYGYDSSSFPSYFFGYGKHFLLTRVINLVDRVFAMSPDMKKDLISLGCPDEKIMVHYYGTDTSRFYLKRDYQIKSSITLLILASLEPQKGHLFLLKSISRILEAGKDKLTLRIVGTGRLRKKLEIFINKNGLNNYVFFKGAIKYGSAEMMEEYKQADIFIHPSVIASNGDKEGIPGTIIEAMSSGLPTISTYHAGIPYVIESEITGLLVQEWDIESLSTSIIKLWENSCFREKVGKAGQNFALTNLSLTQKEIELEKIYVDIL